ncbi:hypothetical protein Dsin_012608 [Dipteronia sinensis]|uniref:glutathione transferase n=1 Tax=Dipteronia sinensis TaxID=43782 RepID=A0AAE0AID8_9ROSI|nr:hypothetical protein Dsin_012608 [Dipteronia sinensis]
MAVKVYGSVRPACPQRVLPFGQVPVVEDGDFRLFESRAIVRYYAAQYAKRGPNLLGTTLEERSIVDQWLEVEAHNFNDLVYTLALQLMVLPRMGQPGDLALVHSCERKLESRGAHGSVKPCVSNINRPPKTETVTETAGYETETAGYEIGIKPVRLRLGVS